MNDDPITLKSPLEAMRDVEAGRMPIEYFYMMRDHSRMGVMLNRAAASVYLPGSRKQRQHAAKMDKYMRWLEEIEDYLE